VKGGEKEAKPEVVKELVAKKGGAAPIASLVPGPRWVSEIVASRFEANRAYVTLDGHRSDDDSPYLFMTEDAGETWRSLTETLPVGAGSTRTICEDPSNGDVLYLGTEFRAFVSLDRGKHWARFNGNLPTVAVHAFAVNVPSGEVVAGTHGRSLWITNVSAIRQMTKEVMAKGAHLYQPTSAIVWKTSPSTGGTNRRFTAQNPASGAQITYHLKKKAESVALEIIDGAGAVISTLTAKTDAGLHTVAWNLRKSSGNQPAQSRGRRFRRGGARVRPGTFTVRLTVGKDVQTRKLLVEIDPDNPDPSWMTFEEEAERLEAELGGTEEGEEHDG
jgi:hypothetical protein